MASGKQLSVVTAATVASLMAALAAGVAEARSEGGATPADLAGVTGVRVAISQTTPDATACGIDLRDVMPALAEGLVQGGLSADPSSDTTVTLSVLTGYDEASGVCASAPMLGVYRQVSYFDEKAGWLRSGQVVLWQRGTATTTASADHPPALRRAVAQLSQALLDSWRTDNAVGLAKR